MIVKNLSKISPFVLFVLFLPSNVELNCRIGVKRGEKERR